MPNIKSIAVFASGNGTNFQALIDEVHDRYAVISCLITDSYEAGAIARARAAGIDAVCLDYHILGKESYFNHVLPILEELNVDLIVLAGFLKILPKSICERYPTINVHPSLIPSFCGKGYYGIKVHEAAIDYGVRVSGASVHFVTGDVDGGPIIMQRAVDVATGDTPESLQRKILDVEHELIVRSVKDFCDDKLILNGRKVSVFN
jgi:phosphoribosylglycinamide formyltransferase-1